MFMQKHVLRNIVPLNMKDGEYDTENNIFRSGIGMNSESIKTRKIQPYGHGLNIEMNSSSYYLYQFLSRIKSPINRSRMSCWNIPAEKHIMLYLLHIIRIEKATIAYDSNRQSVAMRSTQNSTKRYLCAKTLKYR